MEGDQAEERESDSASPESAGIARGIARSVLQVQKRTAIGKVPQRMMPRKAPRFSAKRVATISDKMSNVMDISSEVIEAVVTTEKVEGKTKSSQSKIPSTSSSVLFMKKMVQPLLSFGGNIVKNSLLGAAVFETYDFLIEKTVTKRDKTSSITIHHPNVSPTDIYSQASVWQHFGAGAAAGSVHGVIQKLIDTSVIERSMPSIRSITFNVANHSIAHSVLFGGYEVIKRSLNSLSTAVITSNKSDTDRYVGHIDELEGNKSTSVTQISIVAVSGGIAGTMQQIATHFAEYIETNVSMRKKGVIGDIPHYSQLRLSLPSIRSIVTTFPGNALAFIAFEYGKELIESGSNAE